MTIMTEDEKIANDVIDQVSKISDFPKFKARRGSKQAEQRSLDYWSFRLQHYLPRIPETEIEAARKLCLFNLDESAYHLIPDTAITPEEILAVLQTYVDGLDEDRPQEAINEITSGKNINYYIEQLTKIETRVKAGNLNQYDAHIHRLVDTVMRLVKHIPHIDTVIVAIPESYEAIAFARFGLLRNGLKRIKGVYGDIQTNNSKTESKKSNQPKSFNHNRNSNNNYGGNNRFSNRNNGQQPRTNGWQSRNYGYQEKRDFPPFRNGNGQRQPSNNSGYQYTRPNGNGPFNRQGNDDMELIRPMLLEKGSLYADWDDLLPIAEFAYNNSYQVSLGKTPFMANQGWHPRAVHSIPQNYPTELFESTFALYQMSAQQEMRDFLSEKQDKMAEYANRNRRDVRFQHGEKVLVKSSAINSFKAGRKFAPIYEGPYKISKVINDNAYEVRLNPQRTISLNITNLKKYHEASNEHAHISPFEIDDILDNLHDIERIRRVNQHSSFNELKWKNSDINRRISPSDYSRLPMEYRRILERQLEEDDRVHLRGVTLNSTRGHEEPDFTEDTLRIREDQDQEIPRNPRGLRIEDPQDRQDEEMEIEREEQRGENT